MSEIMSKEKRTKEIISNLEGIIERGGNQNTIDELIYPLIG